MDLILHLNAFPARTIDPVPSKNRFDPQLADVPSQVGRDSHSKTLREAPALYELADTTRVVLVHMERQIRGFAEPFDIGICGHTHKPRTWHDESGRLWVNPGETSGWTYGNPTVALLDTATRTAEILPLGGSREEG